MGLPSSLSKSGTLEVSTSLPLPSDPTRPDVELVELPEDVLGGAVTVVPGAGAAPVFAKFLRSSSLPWKRSASTRFGIPGTLESLRYCQKVQSVHPFGNRGFETAQFATQRLSAANEGRW